MLFVCACVCTHGAGVLIVAPFVRLLQKAKKQKEEEKKKEKQKQCSLV